MEYEIRYASKEMIPACSHIWQECFGDDESYTALYFTNRFTEDNMLVCCVDGKPVSMLSLLPAVLQQEGQEVPIRYVYAVATLPEYRRRGYARRLIEEARKLLAEVLVLEPATPVLEEYYKKLGFYPAFTVSECSFRAQQIQEARGEENGQEYWLLTVTPSEYAKLRDACFAGDGYVRWDEEAIRYALTENDFADGYAYKVAHHGREDILLFRETEDEIIVLETSLSDADLLSVMKRLRMKKGVSVRRPATEYQTYITSDGSTEYETDKAAGNYVNRTLGMADGADICCGYLNLTLE